MDLHPDFNDLLAEFVAAKVSFAVVGGYAVGHYAKPRATKDIDLLVSGELGNLERVAHALLKFGAPKNVVEAARSLAPDDVIYLGVAPVRVDILRRIDGVDTESVLARTSATNIGDLAIPVISLDDLITNKKASGRKQDLADVELLERFKDGT